jgi:murein DD-endopeptidase MepM/ murein hydrolase activator NlpD
MRYLDERITWRRLFLAATWLEIAALVGVVAYLAITDRVVVVSVQPRAALQAAKEEERGIAIPVAGVRREELRDSFRAARSGGRQHLGIDIMAPEGTPVLAAARGVIVKRDSSALGGISLYQRADDGITIYYYAHLSRYAAAIDEGDLVRRGDVIAYVGHTGNANASAPHLHFGVYTVTDPNRWWHGRDLNPYVVLTDADAAAGR